MAETDLSISVNDVTLEAKLTIGNQGTRRGSILAIFTHPYGPLGGNLHNNVVAALYSDFVSLGFTCLRYNARGVGRSTGKTSWQGIPEVNDLIELSQKVVDQYNLKGGIILVV